MLFERLINRLYLFSHFSLIIFISIAFNDIYYKLKLSSKYGDATFDAPFFMAWYASLWNVLFLPIFASFKVCCFNKDKTSTKKMIVYVFLHLMPSYCSFITMML